MSTNLKVLLGVVGGAVLALVVLPIFFFTTIGLFDSGSMMGDGGMMDQGGMMDGGWGVLGILGVLVQLLLWGGLVALIVWAVLRISANRQGGGADARAGDARAGQDSAEEVLRQRFARGEIDAKEYEERHRVLRGRSPAAPR